MNGAKSALAAGCWLALACLARAEETTPTVQRLQWPPDSLLAALLTSAAFGLLGIVMAIFGFKLFDWLTPGNLQKEVFENKNVAAAVLGSSIVIGICVILAAAVH